MLLPSNLSPSCFNKPQSPCSFFKWKKCHPSLDLFLWCLTKAKQARTTQEAFDPVATWLYMPSSPLQLKPIHPSSRGFQDTRPTAWAFWLWTVYEAEGPFFDCPCVLFHCFRTYPPLRAGWPLSLSSLVPCKFCLPEWMISLLYTTKCCSSSKRALALE